MNHSPTANREANAKQRTCCGAAGGGDGSENELVLRVHVIGAKNLAAKDDPEDKASEWGLSDPYTEVWCGTEHVKTDVKEKELSPTWDTVLEFSSFEPETCFREFKLLREDGIQELKKESALKLKVFDQDEGQFESDDLIGEVQLPFPHELWQRIAEEPVIQGTTKTHPCFGWEEEWLEITKQNPVNDNDEPVLFQEAKFKGKDGREMGGYFRPIEHADEIELGGTYAVGCEPVKDVDGDGKVDAYGFSAVLRWCEVVKKDGRRFFVRYDEKMVKKECWGPLGCVGKERPGSPMIALQLTDPDAEGEFVGVILVQCLVIHKREIYRRQEARRAQMDLEKQVKVEMRRRKAMAVAASCSMR